MTEGGLARYQRENDRFEIPRLDNGERIIAQTACLTDQGILFGSTGKSLSIQLSNRQNQSTANTQREGELCHYTNQALESRCIAML